MFDSIIGIFIPPRCAVCACYLGVHDAGICGACAASMSGVEVAVAGVDACAAAASYAGALVGAVRRLKFDGETWRAPGLAAAMSRVPQLVDLLGQSELIVPVPLSSARLAERGFNQARRLASHLGAVTRIPVGERLVRVRQADRQSSLDARARQRIVGAFAARNVRGARVALVDDVVTTGATFAACALALRAAGAARVCAIAVAATELRGGGGALDAAVRA